MVTSNKSVISVVIPCYKVKKHILDVIENIGGEVSRIYVVDDLCPQETGKHVLERCSDNRVRVIINKVNMGVGGATIVGYKIALQENSNVIVKMDGDGQMDGTRIGCLVRPILDGYADFTKGNRFFNIERLVSMPKLRLWGNAFLSLVNKSTSGYWNIMDPTNGYVAIHSNVLRLLPLDKLDNRYFFESDMLFRLGTIRAVVQDIPMESIYGEEVSNLNIKRICLEFPFKYINRLFKRIFYNYFLRDFNIGTMQLILGFLLLCSGVIYAAMKWYLSYSSGIPATSGVVMIAAIPILIGLHLLISAINYDVTNTPFRVIHKIYYN